MSIAGIEQPSVIQIGDALRLRKYDGIIDFAFEWYQDEEMVYLIDGVRETYTFEKLEKMYSYLDNQGELYFIEVKEDGIYKPIGDVTFWKEDMPIVIGAANYRGKQIGRKVIVALAQRAKELGWSEIYVNEIYHYNIASRKCFESVGFEVCGKTDNGITLVMKF